MKTLKLKPHELSHLIDEDVERLKEQAQSYTKKKIKWVCVAEIEYEDYCECDEFDDDEICYTKLVMREKLLGYINKRVFSKELFTVIHLN